MQLHDVQIYIQQACVPSMCMYLIIYTWLHNHIENTLNPHMWINNHLDSQQIYNKFYKIKTRCTWEYLHIFLTWSTCNQINGLYKQKNWEIFKWFFTSFHEFTSKVKEIGLIIWQTILAVVNLSKTRTDEVMTAGKELKD